MEDVEVFNPRMRYTRAMRYGPVEVTEAMFPNYLFARFNWTTSEPCPLCAGRERRGAFNDQWPTVPEAAIEEIRALLKFDGVHRFPNEPHV
jgi:transcriptional antiterminator RfaH